MKKTHATHRPGTWMMKSSLRTARSHPATAVHRNKIYVFGGGGPAFKSLNTVEIYDPTRNRWTMGKEMPTLRSGAMAATMGDRIYVIGGGFKKPDGKFRFLPTVEIYNPITNDWESGPDMIQLHDYPAAAVLEGQIYIMGGHHPDATEGGPQTDPGFSFCERFDPAGPSWTEVAPLPTPRFAASAVVHEGQILTLGGVAFTPQGFKEYDLIEVFDPGRGLWSKSTALVLPWSTAAHGSCIVKHRLYLFGGFSGDRGIGTQAGVFDFRFRTWSIVPPLPHSRAAMGVAVLGDIVYLVGGWAADRSVLNSMVAYRPL
jgi:N-acetylneuraminic acid mutarotase